MHTSNVSRRLAEEESIALTWFTLLKIGRKKNPNKLVFRKYFEGAAQKKCIGVILQDRIQMNSYVLKYVHKNCSCLGWKLYDQLFILVLFPHANGKKKNSLPTGIT